jgi:hypothetical protein
MEHILILILIQLQITNLNEHSAPLLSHLAKALTPVLMIFTLSTFDVTMSRINIEVK